MIQKQVQLYGSLGATELCPGKSDRHKEIVVLSMVSSLFLNLKVCVPGAALRQVSSV